MLVSGSLWTSSIFAADIPTIIATNVNHVVISDVDVEFVTDSGPQTFRMTGSFTLPDATITTADPVYSGTCIPASGTTTSQNMQSCSLTPRVNGVNTTYGHHVSTLTYDDSDVSLTLTSSGSTNVITKIYYQKTQSIYAILDGFVSGQYWFPFVPGDGWAFNSFIYEPFDDTSTVSWFTLDGVQGVRVTVSNSNVVGFKIRRVFENQPSINTSVLGTCNVWNGKWLNVTASEFPVKDNQSHSLLQKILDAILNTNDNGAAQQQVNEIKDTAENKMGGITDATQLVEQGFENLHGDAVNQLTFPGLFGGGSWTLDLGYIEQQAPELVAIMRTMLIAAVAWGCYEMLKNTVLGNRL